MASLVVDVGGTNTRIAFARGASVLPDSVCGYRNADHRDLVSLLAHHLEVAGKVACAMACIAVAGPVENGVARLTNVDWRIDASDLARTIGIARVVLLNDLQAQAMACRRFYRSAGFWL